MGVRFYGYRVMSNHFRRLLQLPRPAALSPRMAGLRLAYWHHYRQHYGLVGPLFQGRFRSPAVDADAYLLSCCRYLERNPIEAGRGDER